MSESTIDLSGEWELSLDPTADSNDKQGTPEAYDSRVCLPGDLASQGFGEKPRLDTQWTGDIFDRSYYTEDIYAPYREEGNIKVPFWLQPELRYVGVAWYRKIVRIPESFVGRRLALFLERPHWETRLWLDGEYLGSNDSLSVPHEYDLGIVEKAGEQSIVLRVDNRMLIPIGPNSHSMADHTQGNWNGVVGAIRLEAKSPVWIERVDLYPSVARHSALVELHVGNALGRPIRGRIRLGAPGTAADTGFESESLEIAPGSCVFRFEYRFPEGAGTWDEFSPALQRVEVRLLVEDGSGGSLNDRKLAVTGLRELSVKGTQIAVNGRPVFLRGTLECCAFPRTGYPPTDLQSWRKLFETVRAHGLNHLRFHSWCPPDAAFDAADELGVYLQVECSTWANQGAGVGVDKRFDEWLYREGERIVARHGNHPSFIMMAYGNEPDGRAEDFLGLWVSYWRRRDGRRLYTSGAGWPAIPENDYHVIPQPRIQAWGEGLASRINAKPPETTTDYREAVALYGKPVVSHEIGQWCSFPNLDEDAKYTGNLKPRNHEIFRDFLEARGMGERARDFLFASGKLQLACYKEEIESALRSPGFGGFQLLGLSDFPGQGTATVGILDAFWESKGYSSPEEFREFCGPTVPLARMAKRYWLLSEIFRAELVLAHFGPKPIEEAELGWELLDSGGTQAASGALACRALPTGRLSALGEITQDLGGLSSGARYELVVTLRASDSALVLGKNRWDIWTFAESLGQSLPAKVRACALLDDAARETLRAGGAVFLSPPADRIKSDVALGFSSVFWNTAWTNGQAPHTLGLVCDPGHPALAQFPTRAYSDWLWWELLHGAAAATLDDLPLELEPIVQPIDTWFRSRRLGLLFEAKVGPGRLLFSGIDLLSDLTERPVARQLRYSLARYMASDDFRPSVELDYEEIAGLLK
jgi:hypothetical protein